jgi:hypothetical protein
VRFTSFVFVKFVLRRSHAKSARRCKTAETGLLSVNRRHSPQIFRISRAFAGCLTGTGLHTLVAWPSTRSYVGKPTEMRCRRPEGLSPQMPGPGTVLRLVRSPQLQLPRLLSIESSM